jgi:hypothetical protein
MQIFPMVKGNCYIPKIKVLRPYNLTNRFKASRLPEAKRNIVVI